MDHLTDLAVNDQLVPPLYVAWATWDRGDQLEALALLERLLSEHFHSSVLGAPDWVLASQFVGRFPELVRRLLSEPYRLSAPPAEIATLIWRQAPRDSILRAVLLGDLRWSDDPFETDPQETPMADQLADLLRKHLRAGLISDDPADSPYGGRPVVTEEIFEVVDRKKLGAAWFALSEPIKHSDAEEWWTMASTRYPRLVIRTFVHDAFVQENGRGGQPTQAWRIIRETHPHYATGVLNSWSAVAEVISADEWTNVAHFVARRRADGFRDRLERLIRAFA